MIIITNLNPNSKRLTLAVLKAYIKKWKIEEYFRFKKQKFDFENFRVKSLKKIRNLDLILSISIGFLALFSNQKKTKFRVFVKKVSERIFDIPDFEYYALADGIKTLFTIMTVRIVFVILKNRETYLPLLIDDNIIRPEPKQ